MDTIEKDSPTLAGSALETTDPEKLLADLDGGVFLQKVGRAMSDVALGTVAHGEKGEITIKFAFKRIGESMQVECDHTITAKSPTARGSVTEKNTTSTPLHVSPRGVLTLFPDHQPSLFGRD